MTINTRFEFAQFPNFTRAENFDVLMREFQTSQAHTDEAMRAHDQARVEFMQWREYLDLTTNYRDLFSAMMKKLLDAKTGDEIQKIRDTFNNKLAPILQKLTLVQKRISGELSVATQESRGVLDDKMARVTAMLAEVKKLGTPEVLPAS